MKNPARSEYQTARIVAALEIKPMTARALATHLHLSYPNVQVYIRRLRNEPRQVRVRGYEQSDAGMGGRPAQIYEIGTAPDAVIKRKRDMRKGPRFPRQEAAVLEIIKEPHSASMVAKKMGIAKSRANLYLRTLRGKGAAHIVRWQIGGSNPIPFHKAGAGTCVPRPGARTKSERITMLKVKKIGWAAALGV